MRYAENDDSRSIKTANPNKRQFTGEPEVDHEDKSGFSKESQNKLAMMLRRDRSNKRYSHASRSEHIEPESEDEESPELKMQPEIEAEIPEFSTSEKIADNHEKSIQESTPVKMQNFESNDHVWNFRVYFEYLYRLKTLKYIILPQMKMS